MNQLITKTVMNISKIWFINYHRNMKCKFKFCLCVFVTDDGVECTIPVLLDGQESIVDLIDLPYSGVSPQHATPHSPNSLVVFDTSICC